MAPLPDRIGRYLVEQELGRGGMGVIYKAHDPEIDRPVALKLIRAELLSDDTRESFVTRFRREAQAAGRCAHPNIVAVYDIGMHGADPFMAMEFVDGTTLAHALTGTQRFAIGAAVAIAQQVLAALACAHAAGIVHRDIKPANVLLQPGGRVKVMDFGIARFDASELTQTGAIVGSTHYMSPEQCRGDPIDHRTDLFSTGTLLYMLLTGCRPFDGRSFTEIAFKLVHQEPLDLRDHLASAPAALAAALRCAMAKRPEDRYPTADAMSAALDAALRDGAVDPDATVRASDIDRTIFAAPLLASAERELASHVGPIARVLVDNAARTAADAGSFYDTLSRAIPNLDRRRTFLDSFSRTAPDAFQLTAEERAQVERETARYLGPIAKVLVKRTLSKVRSMQELRDGLAAHIEKETERTSFLRALPK